MSFGNCPEQERAPGRAGTGAFGRVRYRKGPSYSGTRQKAGFPSSADARGLAGFRVAVQHRIVAKVDALMALCDALESRLKERAGVQGRLAGAVVKQVAG